MGVVMKRTPLKRSTKPIAKRRAAPRRGRVRDQAYMEWIAARPCIICRVLDWLNGMVEVAHVGDRGLGQKCSDRETVPLCSIHHRTGKFSHHVLGKAFWQYYSLDRDAIIKRLNEQYREETGSE